MTVADIDERIDRHELIGWMAHISLLADEERIREHNAGVK